MSILITNIEELVQVRENNTTFVAGKEMKILPTLKNAYLLIDHDTIIEYGKMEEMGSFEVEKVIDATGKIVLPAWCDSHTHTVYSGDRTQEFVDRINGLSYEEIARRGGGILNSAERVQKASEEELFQESMQRVENIIRMGTGAVEIKSGYGLTTEAELKMLRVIKRIKKESMAKIKATFLGAHAIP